MSTAGNWLYRLALPLLVLRMTGSALSTAVIYTLEYVPFLLFSVHAGIVADRFDRRRLLVGMDLFGALLMAFLALAVWRGLAMLWAVYAVALLLSSAEPFYHPAFQSLLPTLVPRERLAWANSRFQIAQSALTVVGPAIGAGAVLALGIDRALGLDALSFAASALAIACMRLAPSAPAAVAAGMWRQLREGLAYLRGQPALLWGAACGSGSVFGSLLVQSTLVFFLVALRGQSVGSLGLVFGALGVGSLAGAWASPHVIRLVGAGRMVIVAFVGEGVVTALLLVLPGLGGVVAVFAAVGVCTMMVIVGWYTLRQLLVPPELLGRVIALTRVLAFLPLPVAPLVAGALLGLTGSFSSVVVLSAVVQVGAGAAAWFTPLASAGGPDERGPDTG